eukprot:TRINITY_DN41361_c0_g1_i1.p1 TRINITY_DN41361_c0_g1~~TRINITY_DN41361_c0_g1_i1.p1  ORF type:complete len:1374 (-),score=259.74 TRINITY_DN41361_c0_g1_i1:228-4349(-)
MEDVEAGTDVRKASTLLIVSFEVPALKLSAQATFTLKPSKQQAAFDWLTDFVQIVAQEREHDILGFDMEGSLMKLETLRKRATTYVDELLSEVKLIAEWKNKVTRAGQTMNRMRDAYYKELFHLREQVYQSKQAEKKGEQFIPAYAMHFDPTEYTMDDEVQKLVAEKSELMRQEFEKKTKELEARQAARSKALKEQLENTRMLLSRKEDFIEKLKSSHGSESMMQEMQDNTSSGFEKEQRRSLRTNDKRATVDVGHLRGIAQISESGDLATLKQAAKKDSPETTSSDSAKSWFSFLERRFGGVKQARKQIALKYKVEDTIGFNEFESLLNDLGYACQAPKGLFMDFSGGKPFMKMEVLFEQTRPPISSIATVATVRSNARRMSAPLVAQQTDLRAIAESDDGDEEERPPTKSETLPVHSRKGKRFSTEAPSLKKSVSARRGSAPLPSLDLQMDWGAGGMELEKPEKVQSDDEGGLSDGSDSGRSTQSASSCCSDVSSFSRMSGGKHGKRRHGRHRKSTHRKKEKTRSNAETLTELAVDTGMESAYSGPVNSIHCFRMLKLETSKDQGTMALPYEASFPKLAKVTRATQSQVDGRMLDKAMDFYDKVAEDNWNQLAGLMVDDEADGEEANFSKEHRCHDLAEIGPDCPALAKALAAKQRSRKPVEGIGGKVMTFADGDLSRFLSSCDDSTLLDSDSDEDALHPSKHVRVSTWMGTSSLQEKATPTISKEALKAMSLEASTTLVRDREGCKSRPGFVDVGVQAGSIEQMLAPLPFLAGFDADQVAADENETAEVRLERQLKQVIEFAEAMEARLPVLQEQATLLGAEAASRGLSQDLQVKLQKQLKRLAGVGAALSAVGDGDNEHFSDDSYWQGCRKDPKSFAPPSEEDRKRIEAEIRGTQALLQRHGYAVYEGSLDQISLGAGASSSTRQGQRRLVGEASSSLQNRSQQQQQQAREQQLRMQQMRRLMHSRGPVPARSYSRASPAPHADMSPDNSDPESDHGFALKRQPAITAQARNKYDLSRQIADRVKQSREHSEGPSRAEMAIETSEAAGLTPGWSGLVQSEFKARAGPAACSASPAPEADELQPPDKSKQHHARRAVKLTTFKAPGEIQDFLDESKKKHVESEVMEHYEGQNLQVYSDDDVRSVCSEASSQGIPSGSPSLPIQKATVMALPDSLNAMRTSQPVRSTSINKGKIFTARETPKIDFKSVTRRTSDAGATLPSIAGGKHERHERPQTVQSMTPDSSMAGGKQERPQTVQSMIAVRSTADGKQERQDIATAASGKQERSHTAHMAHDIAASSGAASDKQERPQERPRSVQAMASARFAASRPEQLQRMQRIGADGNVASSPSGLAAATSSAGLSPRLRPTKDVR